MLEIPSLDIELLILADWDYRKLSKSPCRYSKTAAGDDLVICAHNCKPHFEPLRWVKFDSDMYLTYADGNVHHYKVDNIETLPPTNIEEMITSETEDGSSMWDLTLFTCTPGGASRMAVRCVRVLDFQIETPSDYDGQDRLSLLTAGPFLFRTVLIIVKNDLR